MQNGVVTSTSGDGGNPILPSFIKEDSLTERRSGLTPHGSVFAAIRQIHDGITDMPLTKELQSDTPHPAALQILLRLNLSSYRGILSLVETSSLSTDHTQTLKDYLNESISRLKRDLAVPFKNKAGEILLPTLTPEQITNIPPAVGFPHIESKAAVRAYEFVLLGSNFGSVTTGHRYFSNFPLTPKENGGLEFLLRYSGTMQVGAAVARLSPRMGIEMMGAGRDQMISTAIDLMTRFKNGMEAASAELIKVKGRDF